MIDDARVTKLEHDVCKIKHQNEQILENLDRNHRTFAIGLVISTLLILGENIIW